jgi:hypothetical protein
MVVMAWNRPIAGAEINGTVAVRMTTGLTMYTVEEAMNHSDPGDLELPDKLAKKRSKLQTLGLKRYGACPGKSNRLKP